MVGIIAAALSLLVLPAAIAVRALAPPAEWVAGVAVLGTVLGGVKLIAMAWAVVGRLLFARPDGAIAAAD